MIALRCIRRNNCPYRPLPQTTSTIAASQWGSLGVDASFDMARFREGFSIDIKRYEGDDMEFEMKGVSCAVRRAPGQWDSDTARSAELNAVGRPWSSLGVPFVGRPARWDATGRWGVQGASWRAFAAPTGECCSAAGAPRLRRWPTRCGAL